MPAHTTMADVACGRISLLDHLGNAAVDALARRAALEHRISPDFTDTLRIMHREIVGAATFVAMAPARATLHGKWADVRVVPPPPRKGGRPGQPWLPPRTVDQGGHDWLWERVATQERQCETGRLQGTWRCKACGSRTSNLESRRRERCRAAGRLGDARERALAGALFDDAGPGHRLHFSGSFVWCWQCGYYRSQLGRHSELQNPCNRRVPLEARWRFDNLCNRLHPVTRTPLGEPDFHLGVTPGRAPTERPQPDAGAARLPARAPPPGDGGWAAATRTLHKLATDLFGTATGHLQRLRDWQARRRTRPEPEVLFAPATRLRRQPERPGVNLGSYVPEFRHSAL